MPATVIRACLLTVAAAWALSGRAETSAGQPIDPERLDALVARLGDEDVDVREEAQHELEDLPSWNLELLRARLKKVHGLEARTRLLFATRKVAARVTSEPDRLIGLARDALAAGDEAQATELLRELSAILRLRPEGSRATGVDAIGLRKPAFRGPLVASCERLAVCSDETIADILRVCWLEDPGKLAAEEATLHVYDLRDLTSPFSNEGNAVDTACCELIKCFQARCKGVSLDFHSGKAVVMGGPSLHLLFEKVLKDLRLSLARR